MFPKQSPVSPAGRSSDRIDINIAAQRLAVAVERRGRATALAKKEAEGIASLQSSPQFRLAAAHSLLHESRTYQAGIQQFPSQLPAAQEKQQVRDAAWYRAMHRDLNSMLNPRMLRDLSPMVRQHLATFHLFPSAPHTPAFAPKAADAGVVVAE